MSYIIILEKFKEIGKYHIILAIITHLTLYLSFYTILSISIEGRFPVVYCKTSHEFNTTEINNSIGFILCNRTEYCSNKYETYIDYSQSINNWALKYDLLCEKSIFMKYLTSLIFLMTIVSALVMSIFTDKIGRIYTFQIESIGNLIAFLLLYYETSLFFIFGGVILNMLFSHIYYVCLLYIYEYFPKKYFIILMTIHHLSYGVIGLLATLYSDRFKEIKSFLMIMIIISIISVAYSFNLLTESPDWLIHLYKHSNQNHVYLDKIKENYAFLCEFDDFSKKDDKLDSFKKVINSIEYLVPEKDINKDSKYENETSIISSSEEEKKHYFDYLFQHLNDKVFIKHLILSIFLWIVNQLTFYCTLTNLDRFEEIIDNSFSLFFISNILANVIVIILSNVIEVKNSILFFSIITCINIVILLIISNDSLMLPTCFFLYNLFATIVIESIYLFIPELFQANIRSTAVSYSKIPAKLMLVIAPFIFGQSIQILYLFFLFLMASVPLLFYINY